MIYLPQNFVAQGDISHWLTSIFFSLPPSPFWEFGFKTMEPLGFFLSFRIPLGWCTSEIVGWFHILFGCGFCSSQFLLLQFFWLLRITPIQLTHHTGIHFVAFVACQPSRCIRHFDLPVIFFSACVWLIKTMGGWHPSGMNGSQVRWIRTNPLQDEHHAFVGNPHASRTGMHGTLRIRYWKNQSWSNLVDNIELNFFQS